MLKLFKPRLSFTFTLISSAFLCAFSSNIFADPTSNNSTKEVTVSPDHIEIDKYLGVWYEIARKPNSFQKKCKKNVMTIYTYNENGNLGIDNRCINRTGDVQKIAAEAFIENSPFNSKFKISFLPESIRWIPVVRENYWILKVDANYQMALVGEPDRHNLWLLSRNPHPDQAVVSEFLEYAKAEGYNLKDLIMTVQTEQPKS